MSLILSLECPIKTSHLKASCKDNFYWENPPQGMHSCSVLQRWLLPLMWGIIIISGPISRSFILSPLCTKADAYLWPYKNAVEKGDFYPPKLFITILSTPSVCWHGQTMLGSVVERAELREKGTYLPDRSRKWTRCWNNGGEPAIMTVHIAETENSDLSCTGHRDTVLAGARPGWYDSGKWRGFCREFSSSSL